MTPISLCLLLLAVICGAFWLLCRDYDNLRKP